MLRSFQIVLHDSTDYTQKIESYPMLKIHFCWCKCSLNTVGAVAARTHKTHFPDTWSGSTSAYATRGNQCGMWTHTSPYTVVAVYPQHWLHEFLRVPGASRLHIPLLRTVFGDPTHLTIRHANLTPHCLSSEYRLQLMTGFLSNHCQSSAYCGSWN